MQTKLFTKALRFMDPVLCPLLYIANISKQGLNFPSKSLVVPGTSSSL